MIKKVLIAVDGSHHASNAVAIGSDIAAKYDAEVLLVHVLLRNKLPGDLRRMAEFEHLTSGGDQQSSADIGARSPVADLGSFLRVAAVDEVMLSRDTLQGIGEQILENAERTARDHGVVKIVKRVEDGKPADRILEIAKSEDVDLIVSGARGLSDYKALILGSVSHKLSQLSPVTCLTVR